MTSSERSSSRVAQKFTLDSDPYAERIRQAGELADRVLKRYVEPTLSLEELRARLDRELSGVSLTELVIKGREAGW